MKLESLLVVLITIAIIGAIGYTDIRVSINFARDTNSGNRLRQLSFYWLPGIQISCFLLLASVLLISYSTGNGAEALRRWDASLLLQLAMLLALLAPIITSIQAFTLSERARRRGDEVSAGKLSSKGLGMIVLGVIEAMLVIFLTFALLNPA